MRFRRLIEDYLNPEIKDMQRNVMDLASAQIFSPPCFSFLSLLAAFFLVALYQQYCTTSSIQGSSPKHRRVLQGKEEEQNLVAAVDRNEG